MQNIYFTDQAVLLPFLLTIFFEILIDTSFHKKKTNQLLKILQSLAILWGASTDWFFFFLVGALFLKRVFIDSNKAKLVNKIIRNSYIPLVSFLPIIFLAWQIISLKAFGIIINRFLTRTGINPSTTVDMWGVFWWSHFRSFYGEIGIFLFWISLLIFLLFIGLLFFQSRPALKENKHLLFYIGSLILLPLIQTYILPDHSTVHNFSTLKFSLTLSLVPFVLLPLLFTKFANRTANLLKMNKQLWGVLIGVSVFVLIEPIIFRKYFTPEVFSAFQQGFYYSLGILSPIIIILAAKKSWRNYMMLIISGLLSITYVVNAFPLAYQHFRISDVPLKKIGTAVKYCTKYSDIVFSRDLEIPMHPPHLLAFSMKRVYKIRNLADILKKTTSIKIPFKIVIFYLEKPTFPKKNLFEKAYVQKCSGYYKASFTRKDLQNYLLQTYNK
jgi:hypothetical protein